MLQRPPVAAAARSETANRLASIGDGDVLVYDGDREVLPNTTDRFGSPWRYVAKSTEVESISGRELTLLSRNRTILPNLHVHDVGYTNIAATCRNNRLHHV